MVDGSFRGRISSATRAQSLARFKMRRKIRALASEGRASAMILSALPIGMFVVIQFIAPEFYAAVWNEHLTKLLLLGAAFWMVVGNLIMFKMVNFKI